MVTCRLQVYTSFLASQQQPEQFHLVVTQPSEGDEEQGHGHVEAHAFACAFSYDRRLWVRASSNTTVRDAWREAELQLKVRCVVLCCVVLCCVALCDFDDGPLLTWMERRKGVREVTSHCASQ
jgi:hypothetical protein